MVPGAHPPLKLELWHEVLGPGSCSSANWVSKGPLEAGIQQALSKCTRGAVPVVFQLRPKATRQPAQGVQTGPPWSRYRRLQSCPQDRGEGRGRALALGRGQPCREGARPRLTSAPASLRPQNHPRQDVGHMSGVRTGGCQPASH